jgi:transglutaminase-like putative cysteine protease
MPDMQIRIGYELIYQCPQPTPMIATVNVHYTRTSDLMYPDLLRLNPSLPVQGYRDGFGNWCVRFVAPAGRVSMSTDALIEDSGLADAVAPYAQQHPVNELPDETLIFLLGSRSCETDVLSQTAWNLFGGTPEGWPRVQAICDFVHNRIQFGYQHANPTKTAAQVLNDGQGVCRDFAHLAVALCRCMNIPARYCTGYLGDIGIPPVAAPMDFSGWFEAYLGGQWYTFDARHNTPRIGRVLIARGRDAADVALTTSYGIANLESFRVWTDEVFGAPV